MTKTIRPSQTGNLYERLNVKRNASYREIKRAYKRAAMQWHPDRNHGDTQAREEFEAIREAFRVLSDSSLRMAYTSALIVDERYGFSDEQYGQYTELIKGGLVDLIV